MNEMAVNSHVKALPKSGTWMNQYGLTGIVTEIYLQGDVEFAKVSIPKWLIKREHGNHIINEWAREGLSKREEDFLLLSLETAHLVLSDDIPKPTINDRMDSLVDQAFGPKGRRLSINVIYYPKDLIVTPGECVRKDCCAPRTHLTWHNCHGTVEAFMVCEGHYTELNGRCSDSFPLK